MHLEEIDGLLHILDENYEVIHVFERGNLSRAAYKHMCAWTQKHFDQNVDFDETWKRAEAAWDALTPEQQMLLWSLSVQEQQNAQDICTGLLATLSSYQGVEKVKRAFREAIQGVLDKFA
jgi:lysine/ornithine N-monooxygenase